MVKYDFDLFVIGGGSGGVRASRLAAKLGLNVGIAEEFRFGGTCVIRGCVPKKLMIFASDYGSKIEDSVGFGWDIKSAIFSWKQFSHAMQSEVYRLEQLYEKMLNTSGVKTYKQKARLNSNSSITLSDGTVLKSKIILLAVGGKPNVISIKGENLTISSNEVFSLKSLPRKLVIIGGGYIACEFATIFNALGTKVTLIYRGEKILRGFDDDVRNHVEKCMRARGIVIINNAHPSEINQIKNRLEISLSNGNYETADKVLVAIGRKPNVENLGLDKVDINLTESGAIDVDKFQKTSVDSIYAIGDVTDRLNLTPVAIRDAIAFVETVFQNKKRSPDHQLVPTAVFTRPEIGTVGLTEAEAKNDYKIKIFKTCFHPMGNRISNRKEQMLMKIIICRETDKVLGCHIVGERASEMIQIFGIAIKMGVKKGDLDATCAVHPTLAEELVTLA